MYRLIHKVLKNQLKKEELKVKKEVKLRVKLLNDFKKEVQEQNLNINLKKLSQGQIEKLIHEEELQSQIYNATKLNQELQRTINIELKTKISELKQVNDTLKKRI